MNADYTALRDLFTYHLPASTLDAAMAHLDALHSEAQQHAQLAKLVDSFLDAAVREVLMPELEAQ